MSDTDLVRTDARAQVLGRFRWIDGHADVWHVFRDPIAFRTVVQALADPYRAAGVTAVAGVESRGFLLGGAVAMELGVGFVAIRKAGALFPGHGGMLDRLDSLLLGAPVLYYYLLYAR